MKKSYILIIIVLILSCSSSKEKQEKQDVKCPKIYKTSYSEVLFEKYKTIVNNDTITYNELRFECVYSAFYTKKVMFDKFGIWDKEVFPANRSHPILFWNNVELFSDGKKYDVYTNGIEEYRHIYASVMIFQDGKDLLSLNSLEKKKIQNYFSDLIKKNDLNKSEFYEIYWKKVDPKNWESIQKNKMK